MNDKDFPLSQQELFIHPISILEKEKTKCTLQNVEILANKESSEAMSHNFNEILLQTVDPQAQYLQAGKSKTKHIFKKQTQLTSAQTKKKYYRTSMCPQGIECKKRLVCQFAHTQYELRRPYKNRKNPCVRYQKGLCGLGSACPDYHGNMDLKKKNYKYKVEKCKEEEKGFCSKGKLCIYIHKDDEFNEESSDYENLQEFNFQEEEGKEIKQEKEDENLNKKENPLNGNISSPQNQHPLSNLESKDIFVANQQKKKTIKAKQVVEQIIETKQILPLQNTDQQQNFNIEFNF